MTGSSCLYLGEYYGELYNLRDDPEELRNLYYQPATQNAPRQMVESTIHWFGTTLMQRA
jgi:hypothetical protein